MGREGTGGVGSGWGGTVEVQSRWGRDRRVG